MRSSQSTVCRPSTFTTARLTIAPASSNDLDVLWAIWREPLVRRYLFDDEPVDRERAGEVLASSLRSADQGLGLWTVRPRSAAQVIGCVGLLRATMGAEGDPSLAGAIEPVVALAPACWGRGYGEESLRPLLAYAFGPLGLDWLAGFVDVPNLASHRLLVRLGFTATGECDGPRYRLRTYRLDSTVVPHQKEER